MDDNPFHRHLDECQQCREHPFALCAAGAVILQIAPRLMAAGVVRRLFDEAQGAATPEQRKTE
jgi:hypothetical protein